MRFDLHVHTDHSSDSENSVRDIVRILKAKGFSGAVFLDHNSSEGGKEALSIGEKEFVVIPGIEVSSSEGHILALNIIEPVPRDLGVAETIDKIHELGGIAVAPHPYRYWSGLGEENVLSNDFDAIEGINARSSQGSNIRAMKLARKMNLPAVAGSDSHNNESLGDAYTVFPEGTDSAEKAIEAIVTGNIEVYGNSRTKRRTVAYVSKSVTEWLGRGMKKM